MAFSKIFGRGGLAKCSPLSALLGTIFLVVFICTSATASTVTERASVAGNVRFQGKAVSKALVVASSLKSEKRTTLTNAEGFYAINLNQGTYLLTIVHPQYVVDDGGFGCKLTEVKSGANLTVDFNLTRGGVVSGIVEDVDGQPLVGQEVFYEIVDQPFTKPCLVAGQPDLKTDDQGAFRIFGLPSGKYRIGVGRDHGRQIGKPAGPFRATYYPGVNEKRSAELIDVSPGQETKLSKFKGLTSPRTFSVEVTSVDEDTGNPRPGIDFDLIRVVDGAAVNQTQLKTGEASSVRINNLAPGQYRILAPVRNGESPVRDCLSVSFQVADQDLNDITIRCGATGSSISGVVTINRNSAATDLDCAIALKEGDDIGRQDTPTYSVRLGPEGSFAINGLRKTLYTLVILPLNPSLEYEYVQVDGKLLQDRQFFGRVAIDLRMGPKSIVINLAQK